MSSFPNARQVSHDAAYYMTEVRYFVLRPTFDHSEYTVSGLIDDSDEYQIMVGFQDGPARPIAYYTALDRVMADLAALKAAHPELKFWYDGQEGLGEMKGQLWVGLADVLREQEEPDEGWDLVYKVGTGSVSGSDPRLKRLVRIFGSTFKMAIAGVQGAVANVP